jgi:hypothetical protein
MSKFSFLKVRLLTVATAFASLSLSIPSSNAAAVTAGCASATECTLQELFDGGTMTVGRLVFSDFSFVEGERNPGSPPQANQMIVSGLGNGLSYDFNDELSLASGGTQFMTFRFTYSVSDLLSQAVLIGYTLTMASFINAGNPGAVEGQLNVRDSLETEGGMALGNALVESVISDSAGVHVLTNLDLIAFPPQSAILVSTVVNAMTQDQIELGVLEQRFTTTIPETETFAMLACGLLMLLALRCTRRRHA